MSRVIVNRRATRVALGLGVAALVLALPLVAWACPMCAGRSDANPYAQAALLGSFVFFPFGVVYTVVRYLRAGLRRVDGVRTTKQAPMDDGDRR